MSEPIRHSSTAICWWLGNMTRVSVEQNRVPWRRTGEPPSDGEWEENTQGRDVYVEI